jgi:hypothetical protein
MSFQSYLEGLGYRQEGLKNVGDPNHDYNGNGGAYGAPMGNYYGFQVGSPLSSAPVGVYANSGGNAFNVFVDGNNNYQGVGDYNSLYSSRPDLAQQYNASLFEGGEGAANAARIRQETDQQRILFEQQQQAARAGGQSARKSTTVSRWKYYGVNAISTTATAGSTAASTAARVVGWWTTQTGVCG